MVDHSLLPQFFTWRVLYETSRGLNTIYETVIRKHISNPNGKTNNTLISEIYEIMCKEYRCEYFFQNTLFNLMWEKDGVRVFLRQLPIGGSKLDFATINTTPTAYEIKTGLDNFDRLNTQISDYYQVFPRVCVLTTESQFPKAIETLGGTPAGVYVLDSDNTLSVSLRKEPVEDISRLNHTAIFNVLRQREREQVLLDVFGRVPRVPNVYRYSEYLKLFSRIPLMEAYLLAVERLRCARGLRIGSLEGVPEALKSLVFFANPSVSRWGCVEGFLRKELTTFV